MNTQYECYGAGFSLLGYSGAFWGEMCLCTVSLRGFLAKTLRVHTYITLPFSDTLQTIKELLWQTVFSKLHV